MARHRILTVKWDDFSLHLLSSDRIEWSRASLYDDGYVQYADYYGDTSCERHSGRISKGQLCEVLELIHKAMKSDISITGYDGTGWIYEYYENGSLVYRYEGYIDGEQSLEQIAAILKMGNYGGETD